MTYLTSHEADVLDAMRSLHARQASPDALSSVEIRARVFQTCGVRYDTANRALKSLVEKGRIERPSRGWYRVTGTVAS